MKRRENMAETKTQYEKKLHRLNPPRPDPPPRLPRTATAIGSKISPLSFNQNETLYGESNRSFNESKSLSEIRNRKKKRPSKKCSPRPQNPSLRNKTSNPLSNAAFPEANNEFEGQILDRN
jgi:hypothetical protein